MNTHSQHLLLEFFDCDAQSLDNQALIEALMVDAANASGVSIVQKIFHTFSPQGVTGVVVIEESHLSIHTWPEAGYASVDFYTCGDASPENAIAIIQKGLQAKRFELLKVLRGQSLNQQSMLIAQHLSNGN
ncbi:MAG: adenosylmethionine decarboxylase [Cellvibrionales bacterium]|nr:adenosylmethionine decarboxylase [Cellvibrionales bacterium]